MSTSTPAPGRSRRTLGFGFDPGQSPYHFAVVPDRAGNVTIVERFVWERPSPPQPPSPNPGRGGSRLSETQTAYAGETLPSPAVGRGAGGEGRLPSPTVGRGVGGEGQSDSPKATLTAYLWGRIAEAAAAEFNRRLRDAALRAGSWNKGETLLAPHFGKELTLLAWAVERQDADPTPIPSMIANWSGLAPEERWWFYTTINATGAHPAHGHDRGWRQAIKIAFAENPVQLPSSALLVGPMPLRDPPQRRARPNRHRDQPPSDDQATQGRLRLFDSEDRQP